MYYPPGYFECTRTTTHDNDNTYDTYDTYERQDELIASGGVILYPWWDMACWDLTYISNHGSTDHFKKIKNTWFVQVPG